MELKTRPVDAHKNTFGHALLIAGSYGMGGAAVLAAKSCMKSGVGLLTVHTPECNRVILQVSVPEAMVLSDENSRHFATAVSTSKYSAVGIGPGLGTAPESVSALESQLKMVSCPLVLDADALNIISANRHMLELVPRGTVITPHPGELKRLLGSDFTPASLASDLGIFVICKGAPSVLITPDGRSIKNTTGNSGMATAGSGDVLTGIVLSLLAQGYDSESAAVLASHVAGAAGDLAAMELGKISMTAMDTVNHLPQAWKNLQK